MKVNITDFPQSEVEILFELDPIEWGEFINEARKELSNNLKIDGFRPGHAPKDVVEREIGWGKILERAADLAVKKTYINFITEKKIEAIGQPEIQVLKIAADNPFEFKVKVAVLPQVKLGDWRAVAKAAQKEKPKEINVEEKEINEALGWLQKSRTKYTTVSRAAKMGDRVEIDFVAKKNGQTIEGGISKNHPIILGEGHFVPGFEDNLLALKENDEKKFNLVFPGDFQNKDLADQQIDFEVKMILVQEAQTPELGDDFAKSLGAFTNLAALEKSIQEGLVKEKRLKAKDAWRAKVLENIAGKSEIDLPPILIDWELTKMLEELKENITQMGLDFDIYLKNIKKTTEELKKEWRPRAQERVRAALILQEIAKNEMVDVSTQEIDNEINKILLNYPDAESVKKQIDIERLKEYTKGRLKNEKVFELLESL